MNARRSRTARSTGRPRQLPSQPACSWWARSAIKTTSTAATSASKLPSSVWVQVQARPLARSRKVTQPSAGGAVCPHSAETRACNQHACPVDCIVSGVWGSWSSCSRTCGSGSQSRTRALVQPAYGGAACPMGAETQSCNTHDCVHICSHTTCEYMFTDGEWRTNIFTHSCSKYEMHGSSFHCEHHFGTKTVALGGGFTATHTNECACYCNNNV